MPILVAAPSRTFAAISLSVLLLPAGIARLQDKPAPAASRKPVSVFVLRHAETEPRTAARPDRLLSDAGRKRARALDRLLGRAPVTHLFASEFPRARDTLAELARSRRLEVRVVPSGKVVEQIGMLQKLPPGAVAVVAGHSDTVPGLVRRLGGDVADLTTRGFLAEESHDRVFLVTWSPLATAAVQTIELRYGDGGEPPR